MTVFALLIGGTSGKAQNMAVTRSVQQTLLPESDSLGFVSFSPIHHGSNTRRFLCTATLRSFSGGQ